MNDEENDAAKGNPDGTKPPVKPGKLGLLVNPEEVDKVLFPMGTDFSDADRDDLLEYYKLLAQNTEQLAARRQNLNSFFLSINSLLMAGVGFLGKDAFTATHRHGIIGICSMIMVLGLVGLIICRNWDALIKSYGQMIHSNLVVSKQMERHMIAAIITAQFSIHGKDFLSLAGVEAAVAKAFMSLYTILACAAVYMMIFMHPFLANPRELPSTQPASEPSAVHEIVR
jgi:hypothetical protein